MSNITSNLYPPIVDSYLKPFLVTDTKIKIPFEYSKYNTAEELDKTIELCIVLQSNNKTILQKNQDVIALIPQQDEDGGYYVTLPLSQTIYSESSFLRNTFYKVQLRVCSSNGGSKVNSQWSTVCLIKFISQPSIVVPEWKNKNSDDIIVVTTSMRNLKGSITFAETDESQYISSYRVVIENTTKNIIAEDSGMLYDLTQSTFNYRLKKSLIDGNKYQLKIYAYTNNGYEVQPLIYNLDIIEGHLEQINAIIDTIADEQGGCVKVIIKASDNKAFSDNLVILRTSADSDYQIWQDVHLVTINTNSPLSYVWNDYSIESGTFYKYGIQKQQSNEYRGAITQSAYPVMVKYSDFFLAADKQQIRIRYDAKVQSYKRNVADSITQTLGSKYPFVKRNGIMDYKEFQIGGIITSFNDSIDVQQQEVLEDSTPEKKTGIIQQQRFASKEELFSEKTLDLYNRFYYKTNDDYSKQDLYAIMGLNADEQINETNDYIYEREYRKKIIDFLYKNNIKLFKTPNQGMSLVKVTDINLTPKTEIGGIAYDFSATLIEIDECTLDNIYKYNISAIGEFTESNQNVSEQVFNYYNYDIPAQSVARSNTITLLDCCGGGVIDKQHSWKNLPEHDTKITSLSFFTVTFNSNNPQAMYSIIINDKKFYTPGAVGYYVREDDTITSIEFDKDDNPNVTSLSMQYKANLVMESKSNQNRKRVSSYTYNNVFGQIAGTIIPYDGYLTDRIKGKYNYSNDYGYSTFSSIKELQIIAPPQSVFYIKQAGDADQNSFIIDDRGILKLTGQKMNIKSVRYGGRIIKDIPWKTLQEMIKYYTSRGPVTQMPVEILSYYSSDSGSKIKYYKNNKKIVNNVFGVQYAISDKYEIRVPTYMMITYIGEIEKGVYD